MDAKLYEDMRLALLKQATDLKSLREQIAHQDPSFYTNLPPDVQTKLLLIDRDIAKLQIADLRVAFVGGFSAGKSSLLNAILGEYIVPESTEVTTAIPTYLRACHNGDSYANAHYLTRDELSELEELYRSELSARFGVPALRNAPEKEMLDELFRLTENGRGRQFVEHFRLFLQERKEDTPRERRHVERISIDEARILVKDERKAMFLDRIEIFLPIGIPRDVVLVDLPGVSVPNPRHRRLTFDFIRSEAHAVVFVLLSTRLFDVDETEILELMRESEAAVREKTFWVINRWDSLTLQQRESTLRQFHADLSRCGINEKVNVFKTNSLHGLLAQLASKGARISDSRLQEHMTDYMEKSAQMYAGSHERALEASEISLLRDQLFRFLNDKIRSANIASTIENTRSYFIRPLGHYLRETKRMDEDSLTRGYREIVNDDIRKRVAERVASYKSDAQAILKEARDTVVTNRRSLFAGDTEDLESELRDIVNSGVETDAYETYKDILGLQKHRKCTYYFEIEMRVVDKLNSMLKDRFREIVRKHARQTYDDVTKKIGHFINEIGTHVGFDPQVVSQFEQCAEQTSKKLEFKTMGVVDQQATLLDELLVYKTKSFLGFGGGNQIINGLEEAAKLSCDKYGPNPDKTNNEPITREQYAKKTQLIRQTLTTHYLPTVGRFRDKVAENYWTQVRDALLDLEDDLLTVLDGIFQTRLEGAVRKEVESEHEIEKRGADERSKRFRENINVLVNIDKELTSILTTA